MKRTKITSNGIHSIPGGHVLGTSILYVSGVLGPASVRFVVSDGEGTFFPVMGGSILKVPSQFHIEHGIGMGIDVEVLGADQTTNIIVINAGVL